MPSDVMDGAGAEALPVFDLDDIRTHGFVAKLIERWLENPLPLMALLRRFFPIVKLPYFNFVAVTRYDDVQELLSQDRVFDVPWKQYVRDLNEGQTFLLGMDVDAKYHQIQRKVMSVFRHEDVASIVTPLSRRYAEEVVKGSNGRLEVIEQLISRVPTRICEDYFGVRVVDAGANEALANQQRRDFAHWLIAMSTFTFGNPRNDLRFRRAAMAAGQRISDLVERSILAARAGSGPPDTVLSRLVSDSALDDLTIRTWLISMMTGFVPTCTLASGRAVEMLMRRHDFLERCQEAARNDDDDLLLRCIRETMRFMPIFLGAQRICRRNYVLAAGTPRAKQIAQGDHVLASTWSAMFDDSRIVDPYAFNPGRPPSNYMLFGFGVHACLGVVIAEAQILQTMKVLLKCRDLRRADDATGKMQWLGQFPGTLCLQFATAGGGSA